jgi:tetratricopeptide (TPR) repeat protein
MVLGGELIEVSSGDLVGSHRIEGRADESVFDLIDRLTVKVKNDLVLPESAFAEIDPPVADVTTHSTEAYRAYLDGLDLYFKYYNREAGEKFLEAVEHDSTFAMAYYYLAYLVSRSYADKAIQYAERASRKEKMYIAGMEADARRDREAAIEQLTRLVELYPDEKQAWYRLGQYAYAQYRLEDAVELFGRAIHLDSAYKPPYNSLAYCYMEMDEKELALQTLNEYISRAPGEANPYDTRGDIYAETGRLAEALASYEQAVAIKPDFADYRTRLKVGDMQLYLGQSESAREIYQEVASCEFKSTRSRARTRMAQLPLYQGRFEEAIKALNDGITADELEQATAGAQGDRAFKHALLSSIAAEQGQYDMAVEQINRAIEIHNMVLPDDQYAYRYTLACLLAQSGDIAAAREVNETMKRYLEEKGINLAAYWYARGCISLAAGDHDSAVVNLEQAKALNDVMYIDVTLARAYLAADRPDKAAAELEVQVSNFGSWRMIFLIEAVKCHYYLGLAYEQTGQESLAAAQYETFLTHWSDADPNHPPVVDASRRLARLKHQP